MSQSNTQALSSPSNITKFLSWLRDETPQNLFIKNPHTRIFLVSFSMLFFELLCIRWVPSYVRYLSYFNNFILLASFLGIGLGMLTARRQRFWYPPFPLLVLLMVIIVGLNRFELHITTTDVIYYVPGADQNGSTENFYVLPLIFGMITLCFIPLGRSLHHWESDWDCQFLHHCFPFFSTTCLVRSFECSHHVAQFQKDNRIHRCNFFCECNYHLATWSWRLLVPVLQNSALPHPASRVYRRRE